MYCDDCSWSDASSDSESASVELYSKDLDIVSSRVQECCQVSAAHILPPRIYFSFCYDKRVEMLLAQVHYLRYAQGYW